MTLQALLTAAVVPTPVGVFPLVYRDKWRRGSRPHARGGVSAAGAGGIPEYQSSPRPWGCFRNEQAHTRTVAVVPTPVGVFPQDAIGDCAVVRRPHARGGVSVI